MPKPVSKKQTSVTFKQVEKEEKVVYLFEFYIEEGNLQTATEEVEIIFCNDIFAEVKYDFRGPYRREEWHILAIIDNLITKIEKNIKKKQRKLAGDPV